MVQIPWWRKPRDRVALLLGSFIVLTVGGQLLAPQAQQAPTTVVVPISSLALVCPSLPADTSGYAIDLRAALRAGRDDAKLQVQAKRTTTVAVEPGVVRVQSVSKAAAGLVTASGPAAPQLVADAGIAGTSASTRGFANYACQPPSASQWLVGGSSVAGRTAILTIANVDDSPATVNVEVWTDQGKSGARSLDGIEIGAHSRTQLQLALVEPGRTVYAVHVIATAGQVSSTIIDRGQSGLVSLGIDAIAPSNEPRKEQFVGMIPDGSTDARIAFVSPGIPTTVRVSLLTQDGEFALADAEAMAVDADRLNVVEIPNDAMIGDVAVIVRADDPVIAGATFSLNIRGGSDLASAASLSPIYRAASFTVDGSVSKVTALLRSDRDTSVAIVSGFGKAQQRQSVQLRANRIERVTLVAGSGSARLFAVEPLMDGVVSGALLMQRASVGTVATSVQSLTSLRGFVAVPPVAPALSR